LFGKRLLHLQPLLHDEQCTDDTITPQRELHLQQILPLLCPDPYKHQKTTKLKLNTTKEEGNHSKLPLSSSLEHRHKRRQ
jgi:hypothetical protein